MKLGQTALSSEIDAGRKAMELREVVLAIQDSFTAMEKVRCDFRNEIFSKLKKKFSVPKTNYCL